MIKKEEVYRIGRIGKPHGVKGEVQLQFDDDTFDRVDAEYLVLDIDGILVPFFMEEYRFRSDTVVLMKFDGIDTQDQARELTGCEVYFSRELAEQDEDRELTWNQLTNFKVYDLHANKVIGKIVGIDTSTVNTLFDIETESGATALLPANEDFIKDIDVLQQTVTMELPEGILDLN